MREYTQEYENTGSLKAFEEPRNCRILNGLTNGEAAHW
jgi:hypothetical protein